MSAHGFRILMDSDSTYGAPYRDPYGTQIGPTWATYGGKVTKYIWHWHPCLAHMCKDGVRNWDEPHSDSAYVHVLQIVATRLEVLCPGLLVL